MLFYVVWFVVFFQAYQVMFWANNSSMMVDVPLWHWECIRFIGTGHLTWIESCKLMAQLTRNAGTYFLYVYFIYIIIYYIYIYLGKSWFAGSQVFGFSCHHPNGVTIAIDQCDIETKQDPELANHRRNKKNNMAGKMMRFIVGVHSHKSTGFSQNFRLKGYWTHCIVLYG